MKRQGHLARILVLRQSWSIRFHQIFNSGYSCACSHIAFFRWNTTAWAGRLGASTARSSWGLGLPLRGTLRQCSLLLEFLGRSLRRAGVGVGETTAEGLLQLVRTAGVGSSWNYSI